MNIKGTQKPQGVPTAFSFRPGAGQSYGKADLIPVAGVRLSLALSAFPPGFFSHRLVGLATCWGIKALATVETQHRVIFMCSIRHLKFM